ncbi:MAG: GAF domain-containing protein [Gammaproteobacteria bacterium]|nr:GAF domain-containing protein [Gammaproteobacteria bacterium]
MNFFNTLKFQIGAALLLIVVLFTGIVASSLKDMEQQRSYSTLLNITARLEQTTSSLVSLGMNYAGHAPVNPAGYRRDVILYYREIQSRADLFEEITHGFMTENFSPSLVNQTTPFTPKLDPDAHEAVQIIEDTWAVFRTGLMEALGTDSSAPGLERAAQFINANHKPLSEAIQDLRQQIERLVEEGQTNMLRIHWGMLLSVVAVTFGILTWFFVAILRPLDRAVTGFQKVAQGDFGYQVPTSGNNELTWLTGSFNQLSSRLHAIFLLIDRIQEGSDMDETLCFVADQFPQLLPLDWVGALFMAGDDRTISLERSYRDGKPEISQRCRFRLQETLLQQALQEAEPLHVPDMKRTAEENPGYQFLNFLTERGLRDAIFLPITDQSPIPGVLVFATRKPDSYSEEHLELLTNIARLVTHSFGRTLKLSEHARLASIGGFASGIAHEIRSPLSTIGMALDYLQQSELAAPAEKRVRLARQESERMSRLLEEILLYAKPLKLELQPLSLASLIGGFIENYEEVAAKNEQQIELLTTTEETDILGDKDRLQQIFLNLSQNAFDASPPGSVIKWQLRSDPSARMVILQIQNPGVGIPDDVLPRLFDPFFTTKATGTGLGLGIVKRMVDAHGGEIQIDSQYGEETVVTLHFPLN